MYYKKMSDMEVQILREGLELYIQVKENMKAGKSLADLLVATSH